MVNKINLSSFEPVEFVELELDNLHAIIPSYLIILCARRYYLRRWIIVQNSIGKEAIGHYIL